MLLEYIEELTPLTCFLVLARRKTQQQKRAFSLSHCFVSAFCQDTKLQTYFFSHILNNNGGDTLKITEHAYFNQMPGQDTTTGATVASPAWPPLPAWPQEPILHIQNEFIILGGTRTVSPVTQAVMPGWRFRFQILLTRNAALTGNCTFGAEKRKRLFLPLENPAYKERYLRARMLAFGCLRGFDLVPKSQNHRVVWIGRDLCRSPSPPHHHSQPRRQCRDT